MKLKKFLLIAVLLFSFVSVPVSYADFGADICSGGTSFADNYVNGWGPQFAFDGVLYPANGIAGTCWYANTGGVHSLGYSWSGGQKYTVAQYTVTAAADVGYFPKTWTFQGQSDDAVWHTLDTQTNLSFSHNETKIFNAFTNTTAYSSYRLYMTAYGSSGQPEINELQFMEVLDDHMGGMTADNYAFIVGLIGAVCGLVFCMGLHQ